MRGRAVGEYRGMQVLVAGGAGFIGSHLVDGLLGQGAQVVALDSLLTGDTLYFTSGRPTPAAVARQTRDCRLALARRYGIGAPHHHLTQNDYPPHTAFQAAGFPLLDVPHTTSPLANHD